MPLADVCLHRGTRYEDRESGGYVEGSSDVGPVAVQSFACCLFLPLGDEVPDARGGRQVRRPTLLVMPLDEVDAPVALGPKVIVGIVAPELNVAEGLAPDVEVRWQVQGSAQPMGKPGDDIIGFQVNLLRVED